MIAATLELYAASARDAANSFVRSAWAMFALMLAGLLLVVVSRLVAPLGIAGGFIMGFVEAGAIGWYLSLLEMGLNGRRSLAIDDLREQIGAYFNEVLSVLFLFFIASWILDFLRIAPLFVVLISLAAGLAFNPAPEVIYQDRQQSTGALETSFDFMKSNALEWLLPHVVAGAFLAVWGWAMGGGLLPVGVIATLIRVFGPFFGFLSPDTMAMLVSQPTAGRLAAALAFYGFVHLFMLFRGHLYRRLGTSSRRSRSWRGR